MQNDRIRIAIVEDYPEMASILQKSFSDDAFEIVGIAGRGGDGLQMILNNEVDVALLDIALPGQDGFYVLDQLRLHPDKKPICIMLSGFSKDDIIKRAMNSGADYFVLKPFDTKLLVERVKEMALANRAEVPHVLPAGTNEEIAAMKIEDSAEDFVVHFLYQIPIPTNLRGYQYLKMAILLCIEDPSMCEGITKVLYPTVAKKHQTTSQRVERAIRHAIDSVWTKGSGINYYRAIRADVDVEKKPTNSMFISSVVELYNTQHKNYNR